MTRLAEACYSQTTNSSTNPNTAIYQTCGQTRIFQHNPSNNYKQTIHSMIALIFDEDVIYGLKKIIELIEDDKTKTRFDHVRGNVESKELMVLYLKRAIEIIKEKRG